jgi:hypothetical protein
MMKHATTAIAAATTFIALTGSYMMYKWYTQPPPSMMVLDDSNYSPANTDVTGTVTSPNLYCPE